MSVHPVLVICQWIAAVWIHRVLLVVPSKGAQWPRDHTAGCCQVLYKRKKKISSSEEKGSGWVYFILLHEPGSHRRSLSSYKFFRRIVFLSSISAVSFSSLTDLLIFRISFSRKLIFFFISAMVFTVYCWQKSWIWTFSMPHHWLSDVYCNFLSPRHPEKCGRANYTAIL